MGLNDGAFRNSIGYAIEKLPDDPRAVGKRRDPLWEPGPQKNAAAPASTANGRAGSKP